MELPAMTQSLLEDEESQEYGESRFRPVADLDVFFSDMYHYYYSHGLTSIILAQVCGSVSLGFTVFLSVFLLGFLDWHSVLQCHDEDSCHHLSTYIVMSRFGFSSISSFVVMTYALLFIAYWIFRCGNSIQIVSHAIDMEIFYREKLGITSTLLQTMSWNDVVQRMIQLHEHKIFRVAIKDRLTEHDIVARILRKDNYMVALINMNILDLRLPWWATPFLGSDTLFLTKSLEWSLSFCIMEHLFNDQFNVSTVFLKDVQGLQSRFLLVGLVHFLLLPFMILFMIIHFTLQNIQQFHSSKSYLGPRQWSPYALWKFREFNELKHVFEQRILQSYKPLNEYLHTFHIPYLAVGARCCVYLSGSLLAVLLIVSLIDEAVLLYIHVGDHNLLWYLGIFTAVYGASNSMIPDETVVVTREEQETLVQKVSAFTHFSKVEWQDRCHTTQVRDELVELFPYKVQLFFLEIMSVILTPIVLCFSLPQCSYDILHFIRDHSKYLDGVGAICDYSLMELDIYGDEDFGTVIDRGRVSDRDRPHDGKLEQSYMSFQQQHPTWAGNPTGRNLMNKINDYKQQVEDERQSMISSTLYQSMNLMRSHHAPPAPAPHGHGPLPAPLHSHAFSPNAPMNSDHRPQAAASAGAAMAQQDSVPSLDLLSEQESAPLSPLPSCGGDLPMFAQNSQSLAAASAFLFSAMGSGGGSALDNMPSVLRSVLRKENIDYENDFYWLTKFQRDRVSHSISSSSILHSSVAAPAPPQGGGGRRRTAVDRSQPHPATSYPHEAEMQADTGPGAHSPEGSRHPHRSYSEDDYPFYHDAPAGLQVTDEEDLEVEHV